MDTSEYQKQVQELRTQIHGLEEKLAEIHATDVKALDRAHKSLCQHVDALQLESTGVLEGLEDLQTDLVTPEHVAEELTAIGFVTGGVLAAHRLLGLTPFKGSVLLLRGCWLASGAYIAWRLSVGSVKRLSHMAGRNRRLKRDLLNVWRGIQERMEIMQALAVSAPQLGHAEPKTVIQDSLPSPSAPPMAGESGTGLSSYPPVWQPSQGITTSGPAAAPEGKHSGAAGVPHLP